MPDHERCGGYGVGASSDYHACSYTDYTDC